MLGCVGGEHWRIFLLEWNFWPSELELHYHFKGNIFLILLEVKKYTPAVSTWFPNLDCWRSSDKNYQASCKSEILAQIWMGKSKKVCQVYCIYFERSTSTSSWL